MAKKEYSESKRVENKIKHVKRGFHPGMKKYTEEKERELLDKIRLKKKSK